MALILMFVTLGCRSSVPLPGTTVRNEPAVPDTADRPSLLYFQNDSLLINRVTLLQNRELQLRMHNRGTMPITACVELGTEAGYWFEGTWSNTYRLKLDPGQTRSYSLLIRYINLTPASQLQFVLGTCRAGQSDRQIPTIGKALVIRWYKPDTLYPESNRLSDFTLHRSDHFEIYAWKDSFAAGNLQQIVMDREQALADLSEWLGVSVTRPIRLVLYPTQNSKIRDTGIQSIGWASDRMIVEVYNRSVQLDPYHELSHVLTSQIGAVPSLINEGLATYASGHFDWKHTFNSNKSHQNPEAITCTYKQRNGLTPLYYLFELHAFDFNNSRAQIYYPQSASFVGFLISEYGMSTFLKLYRSLNNPKDPIVREENYRVLERIYGVPLHRLEHLWESNLCR